MFISKLRLSLAAAALSGVSAMWAQAPQNYYSSCENKGGAALLSALCSKVGPHTSVGYDGLWKLYPKSDVKPSSGKIWDMYSTKEWSPNTERCGNYSRVGDCYNREHSFPKSWFNDAQPMYCDAFHIYPTDGKVNGQRSNFPYGECANGTTQPSNGGIDALGKLGPCTFPGYSGTVFEPVDEYKGDFARSYFYMAAAYNDRIASWSSPMLAGNNYPCFTKWSIDLLMKWHRQDPVSQKEINRNNAVYAEQNNRNPFIDHPEMAEYIWGNKQGQAWTYSGAAEPRIVSPVDGAVINLGTAAAGRERRQTVYVKGSNLSQDVRVYVTGAGFSASTSTLAASAVNTTAGAPLEIVYKGSAAGTAYGTLSLASGTVSVSATLSVNILTGLPATAPTDITPYSFKAHWTYIGDEDPNGCYNIRVVEKATGMDVDTYPRSVPASAESFLVDELMPQTQYTYIISTASGLKSNPIDVLTGTPVPSIQFMYDGELALRTAPGTPSDVAEILVEIDNISDPVQISVTKPFEISTDKNNWQQSLTLQSVEDRIYLRLFSETEGVFTTTLTARAGDYLCDDTEITGTVATGSTFSEGFEANDTGTSYGASEVQGDAALWKLTDAGVFNSSTERHSGYRYVRFGKTETSSIATATPIADGIGTVTLFASAWSKSEGAVTFVVETSSDNENWTMAGVEAQVPALTGTDKEYRPFTFTVNKAGAQYLRIRQTTGKRWCLDDLTASSYSASGIDGVESDYHSWDAYCHNGQLCVESARPVTVAVYGMDGNTYFSGSCRAGVTRLNLPAGLYVVAVADFTRRVLVK